MKNYSQINQYQKEQDKIINKRVQESLDRMEKERIEKLVRENSP